MIGFEMNCDKVAKNGHNCENTMAEFMAQMPRRANTGTNPKIDDNVALLLASTIEDATKNLAALYDSENLTSIFSALRATEDTASPQAAETLGRVVAMTSNRLPQLEYRQGAFWETTMVFKQATVFVAEILRRIEDEVARAKVATIIIADSPSLPFVCDVMEWSAGSMTRIPVFTPETQTRLQCQLADRIDQYLSSEATPVYLRDRENVSRYLRVLLKADRRNKVRTYLTYALTSRPESVCEFLWALFPNRGRDLKTGQMTLIRILPQQYDFLSGVIDPAFVADLVRIRLKDLPDNTGQPNSESEWNAAHLKQFLAFHQSAGR